MLIHLLATLAVVGAGFWLELDRYEWLAICFATALVWIAEAFNTALEFLTDLVSPEYHPLAGRVKDVAAAGVLIAALFAVVTGLIVFLPKLL